jgi:hypothetical protein
MAESIALFLMLPHYLDTPFLLLKGRFGSTPSTYTELTLSDSGVETVGLTLSGSKTSASTKATNRLINWSNDTMPVVMINRDGRLTVAVVLLEMSGLGLVLISGG